MTPGVAWAGKASDLMAQIEVKKTELGEAVKKEDELTSANQADLKQRKTYADNNAELEARIDARAKKFLADTAKQRTYREGLVENYNSQCDKNRVGALPAGYYNDCKSLGAEVDKIVAGIDADVERQKKLAQADMQPLANAATLQEKEMAAIDARVKTRTKALQDAKDSEARINADLVRLRTELARVCADPNKTIEDMKYCASIGWDGTSQTLPPLTQLKPPFSASPNQ